MGPEASSTPEGIVALMTAASACPRGAAPSIFAIIETPIALPTMLKTSTKLTKRSVPQSRYAWVMAYSAHGPRIS